MKDKVLSAGKYLFFLALGVFLLWLASKDLSLGEILAEAKNMNFMFFIASATMALTAHYSRAVRWRYLIRTLDYNPKIKNVFLSVLFMYFSNLIIPRSGEVARCGTLFKYEGIPVKKLLGTVIVERIFDLITLLAGTALLVVLQFDTVGKLYYGSSLPKMINKLSANVTFMTMLLLLLGGFIAMVFVLRKRLQQFKLAQKLLDFISEVVKAVKQVLGLKNRLAFLGHTLLIWVMYFSMTYVCFFAYEPTASLGLSAGFAVFIAGSYGMVAPTNGGIGAWHLMVILALGIFGISNAESTIIANVAFAAMTLSVAIFGTVSIIILPFLNKNSKQGKNN